MNTIKKHPFYVLGSIGAFLLIILTAFALNSPAPLDWDEGYYISSALGYLRDGTMYVRMWEIPQPTSLINGGGQGYGFILYLTFLKIFGVDVVTARVFSYLFAILSLFACYAYTARRFGSAAGKAATIFYAISVIFFHFISARFDSISIFVIFLLLLAFEEAKRRESYWQHFIFGFFLALSLEFHLHLSALLFAISALYLIAAVATHFKKNIVDFYINWWCFLFYMFGAGAGALIFTTIHFGAGSEAFFAITESCVYCNIPFLARQELRFQHLFEWYTVETFFLAIVIAWSVSNMFRLFQPAYDNSGIQGDLSFRMEGLRRTEAVRSQLFLFLLSFGFFIFFIPPHYEFFIFPFLAPLVGLFIAIVFEKEGRVARIGVGGLLIVVALRTGALIADKIIVNPAVERNVKIANCIRANSTTDSKVLGPGPEFIHLADYHNYIELGRGVKYAIILNPYYAGKGESGYISSFITRENPELIWLGNTDWPLTDKIGREYVSKNCVEICGEVSPDTVFSCVKR